MAFQKKESNSSQLTEKNLEASKVEVQEKEVKVESGRAPDADVQTSYFSQEVDEEDEFVSVFEELPKVDFKQAGPIVNDKLFMNKLTKRIKKINFSVLSHEESIEKATAILQIGEKYGYFLGTVMGSIRAMTTYTKNLDNIKSYLLAEFGFTPDQADEYLKKYCDEYGIPS